MKSSLAAAALIALGSLPAAADTLAEKPDCAADLAYAVTLLDELQIWRRIEPRPDMVPVEENGRCVLRKGGFSFFGKGLPYQIEMDEVVWAVTWGEPGRVSIPQKLVLDIKNSQRTPLVAGLDAEMVELIESLESSSWSLHFDYAIGPDWDWLELNRFGFTGPTGDAVQISGRLQLVEDTLPLEPNQAHQEKDLGIKSLELKVQDEGYLEITALSTFKRMQQKLQWPEKSSDFFVKLLLSDGVRQLPEGLVDQHSRSALLAMVKMLPHPHGIMHFKINSETGLFLNDIEALEEGGEEPLVERLQRAGITISARHEPVLP
ncbi:Uncharacterised protein [Pannonibacter phragmitetus]|uniref:DUF2125 domain-containing protein n=1 Tax=Pannonibacter phragmitetus TaxID=121719 RepID=A0A378ZX28_9HYPH|nr:hypothetical protein [Pannonibacter phragmitetus]SUB01792.1 Uncharacterised protein [Pannonibacter phragmitetus]